MPLFRLLLFIYPRRRRDEDGPALLETLECRIRAAGRPSLGMLWREAAGLVRAGLRARFRPAPPLSLPRTPSPMTGIARDVRFALRSLRRDAGFALVSVMTLALGIGVNVAIFSVVNAVILQPLPYPDPERLAVIGYQLNASKAIYAGLAERAASLDALVAHTGWGFTITDVDEPQVASGGTVSANFFDVFGGTPILGRTFVPDDARPGNDDVVILSERLWRQHYGAAPDIVGRRVDIANDHHPTRVVIGVMPIGSPVLGDWELWVPLGIDPADERDYFSSFYLQLVGRLAPGVTVAGARLDVEAELGRLGEDERHGLIAAETSADLRLVPLHEAAVGSVRPTLMLLLGAVVSVLLIACTNVANLLLMRSGQRARELAVRGALGAGRARLVRQLATEAAVLGTAAGGVGLLAASWTTGILRARLQGAVPRADSIGVDLNVALYAVAVSVLAAAAFGLVPAMRASGGDLARAISVGGRGGGREQGRLASLLVVAEVAIACVLVITAGLLVRSLIELRATPSGFDSSEVLTLRVTAPATRYPDASDKRQFWELLHRRLSAARGVEAVGAIHLLPLQQGNWNFPVRPEGFEPEPDASLPLANFRVVTPGYFDAMGIGLREGRDFEAGDDSESLEVAIVNRAFADRFWPGEAALDREVLLFGSIPLRVVGVVEDVRQHRLDRAAAMTLYRTHTQWPLASMVVTARPRDALATIQQVVREIDPRVPIHDAAPMGDVVSASLGRPRLAAALLSSFALLALTLGAIGVYGVLSYAVSCRRQEIGIRMALGSGRQPVMRAVIGSGLRSVAAGLALGLLGAWATGRWLADLLYGVDALDPLTYAAVALLLLATGTLAGYLPARRAARVDPMIALRRE